MERLLIMISRVFGYFFFFNDDGDRPEVEDLRRGETVEIQQSSQLQFR